MGIWFLGIRPKRVKRKKEWCIRSRVTVQGVCGEGDTVSEERGCGVRGRDLGVAVRGTSSEEKDEEMGGTDVCVGTAVSLKLFQPLEWWCCWSEGCPGRSSK